MLSLFCGIVNGIPQPRKGSRWLARVQPDSLVINET